MAKLKLQAPDGVSEASVGETLYTVNPDHSVEVDTADAATLLAAGFTGVGVVAEQPTGLVPMHCEPNGSCSYGGETFTADDTGLIQVPAPAVAHLLCAGFTSVEA